MSENISSRFLDSRVPLMSCVVASLKVDTNEMNEGCRGCLLANWACRNTFDAWLRLYSKEGLHRCSGLWTPVQHQVPYAGAACTGGNVSDKSGTG